jgi:hypothetical protein
VISGPAVMEIRVGPMSGTVLGRAAAAVGAQAGLDVDALADLSVVSDCLMAGAEDAGRDRLRVVLIPSPGRVEIRVGPLPEGTAGGLRDGCQLPALGSVLDRLADVRVDRALDGEYLLLAVGRPPA